MVNRSHVVKNAGNANRSGVLKEIQLQMEFLKRFQAQPTENSSQMVAPPPWYSVMATVEESDPESEDEVLSDFKQTKMSSKWRDARRQKRLELMSSGEVVEVESDKNDEKGGMRSREMLRVLQPPP